VILPVIVLFTLFTLLGLICSVGAALEDCEASHGSCHSLH